MELKIITYFIGKMFSALIMLLIIPCFITWFGKEKYGEFILIYTTFLIFLSGSIGWINQSMIKFHSEHEDHIEKYYANVHMLTQQVALIVLIPFLTFIFFTSEQASITLIIILAIAFFYACKYTSKLIEYQTKLKSIKYTIAEVLRLLTYFGIVFIFKENEYISVLELIFLAICLSYLIGFLFLNKGFNQIKISFNFDKKMIKTYLSFGLPLSLWMVFSPGANGLDRYIISYSLGAVALAQYTAIYDVVFKAFTQLANPINSVYQPLLMKIYIKGDLVLFNKTVKKAIVYLILISIPVFITIYLLQDFIIIEYLKFEKPEDVILLKQILIPLMLSSLFWQIAIIIQKRLEAEKKTLKMTLILISVIVFYSLVAIIFVSYLGIILIAYLSTIASISYLIIIMYVNYESKKKIYS